MKHGKGWKLCLVAAVVLAGLGMWAHGLAAGGAGAAASANDWPTYRGPNGNGISDEKGWSSQWATEPNQLWKAQVGKGYSSVAVAGGKLYTLGNADGKEDILWCLDAKTGKEVWKKTYACKSPGDNPGPRSTPTVNDGRVYTVSRDGQIICWDAANGDQKWVKTAKEFGGKAGNWAFSGSATVVDKAVVVDVGVVVALDKATGDLIWKSAAWKAGYSTPVACTIGGKKCVLAFVAEGLKALAMADGNTVWQYPWKTNYDVSAATPVLLEGKVFITSGYNVGCAMVDLEKGTEIWSNKKKAIASHFTTPILYKGYLYGIHGSTGQSGSGDGVVACLDLDGKEKWTHAGCGTGSLMLADGKLIIQGWKGDLVVAEASPDGWKELAKTKALSGGICWTMPVLSGGVIYCRNADGELVALDVSGK